MKVYFITWKILLAACLISCSSVQKNESCKLATYCKGNGKPAFDPTPVSCEIDISSTSWALYKQNESGDYVFLEGNKALICP